MSDIVKGLFQLEIESKQIIEGLKKVAGSYTEISTEVKAQLTILKQLQEQEKVLLATRTKTNNPSANVAYTNQLTKVRESIGTINKQLGLNEKESKKVAKANSELASTLERAFKTTAIVGAKKQVEELGKSIANTNEESQDSVETLRQKYTRLKAELSSATDPQRVRELAQQTGELRGKLDDATNAARVFSSDSKFKNLGSAIHLVGEEIFSLNFSGASKSAKLLTEASAKITFKEALHGIKDLGSTIFDVGKALLLNPLFLIGFAVQKLIANFDRLKESGGAIGALFKGIGEVVHGVILTFKTLASFFGLFSSSLSQSEAAIKRNNEALAETKQLLEDLKNAQFEAALNQAVDTGVFEDINAEVLSLLKKQEDTTKEFQKKAEQRARLNAAELLDIEEDKFKEMSDIEQKAAIQGALRGVSNIDAKQEILKQIQASDLEQTKIFNEQRKVIASTYDLKIKDAERKDAKDKQEKAKKAADEALERRKKDLDARIELEKRSDGTDIKRLEGLLIKREQLEKDFATRSKAERELALLDRRSVLDEEAKKDIERRRKILEALAGDEKVDLISLPDIQAPKAKANSGDSIADKITFQEGLIILARNNNEETINLEKDLIEFRRKAVQEDFETGKITFAEKFKSEQELNEQLKKLDEEKAQRRKPLIAQEIENINTVVQASLQAANTLLSIESAKVDKQIELQQRRVDEVHAIAADGNAELLEEEKKRLDDLNKEKEKFVRAQQALAVVELVANTAVAISKAAAEGGVAAPFTIAATLIALIAGLAQAKAVASQAAFYHGGYTGDGNPREQSQALGKKPYQYHKGEFVFDHNKTNENKDIFYRVHRGEINLRDWQKKVRDYDKMKFSDIRTMGALSMVGGQMPYDDSKLSELNSTMKNVYNELHSQERLAVNINEDGFHVMISRKSARQSLIENIAS